MKVNVTIDFPSLDRKIVAFHYGDDGEEASRDTLQYFIKQEVEDGLEFLADDYHNISAEGKVIPLREKAEDPFENVPTIKVSDI